MSAVSAATTVGIIFALSIILYVVYGAAEKVLGDWVIQLVAGEKE